MFEIDREKVRERGERKRWEIENVENMFVSLLTHTCRYQRHSRI